MWLSDMVLEIDFFHLFDIDFSFTIKSIFGRWKQHLFNILFFAHYKILIFKKFLELPINTTFDLKFPCSTGDKWNLVYNKK